MKSYYTRIAGALCALSLTIILSGSASAQKLTVDEVVAKHLASLGDKDKIAAAKERMAVGISEFESKSPPKKTNGKALIASRNDDFMFLVSLSSKEYPFEKIGFFANKVSLPWVTAGARSPLGAFIADHEKVLSDGVFGGTIASTWLLLDPEMNNARVRLAGKKKVDDRETHVLEIMPKGLGSGEFTIRAYLDTTNFQHVRTEYRHQINPAQDNFGQLGRQAGVVQTLVEKFGDYKTVDGLTLPYSYTAHYTTESNSGTYEFVWRLVLQQYHINPKLDVNFFTFEPKTQKSV